MKAAPFEYCPVGSVEEAVALLAEDEGAKVLAGGQSLVPLMA
ncbi:MAG TPA: xanthine dehydrogenase family protein subunit M, partial [Candidatus Dormibacteraeota bacterium]|nr:xanthine dehydrogenase family protein subunit M [Candidatus Dormibacteraeota bacterium]